MTEKRFKAKLDECGVYYYVCENGEILAETYGRDDAEDIVNRLNELYDENEQLKKQIQRLESKLKKERRVTQKQHEKWDKQATERINGLSEQNWSVIKIIIEYDTTNKYENANEVIDKIKEVMGLVMIG